MTDLSLPPATLDALRARHVSFLATRLTNAEARADFVRSFVEAYDYVLERRVRDLVDPAALVDAVTRTLGSDVVRGFFAPIVHDVHRRTLASLRGDDGKLGDYVPAEARAEIDALLARPDLVPEALVRRIFEDEATEDVMRDVLYDALVEFNDSVNPFFAEWGLPSLLKKVLPIGAGAVLKSIGHVRAEFDKRLEPEMRKFLLAFARKSKQKMADFVVSRSADPKFIALRKSVVAFFYEQTLSELTAGIDDDARTRAATAAEHVALEVLRRERPRERLRAELDAFVRDHGEQTLAEHLASLGVTARPQLEHMAEALWPYVKMLLESPPARAFYERVATEFYATIPTSG